MPHIELESHLPGITGLLEYRKDTGQPIRELTQILMRGPSTLSEGERELIATIVSHGNQCRFCTTAHTAAADLLLGDKTTTQKMKDDIESTPVSEKMKALITIGAAVGKNGKLVTPEMVTRAKTEGATDAEIHDTVLIAAAFCMFNRYVDGLATWAPDNRQFYVNRAPQRAEEGYIDFDLYK